MPYRKQFLDAIKQGAIDGWHKHKILPSIAGVQALHESDYGRSSLAKAPNYNIFGIKASADWKGAIVSMPTKEHVNGRTITIQANFRKYDSWGASVADYGTFFTSTEWRKNNYRHVVGERDYKKAAWALQNSGYATDPQYANKLIKRLEENGLQAWDADIDKAPSGTVNKTSVGGNLTQAGRDYLKNIPVTVLGDSLGVGTQPKLKEIMDNMTYSVYGSRQLTHSSQLVLDATRALESMLSQPEKVRNNLVVIIGTNAGLVRSDVDKFIKIAGNRKIYWVNTASKGVINQARRDNVTNEIRRAAETYSNVYLLDWDKFSAPNWSSYYGGDSVHMNATGYTKHAEFIAQGIYEVLNSKQTEAPSIPKEQRDDDGVQLKKSYIGIENVEYDDGRFYTLKGESSIQDREANLRFSRHHSSSFGWITRPANFDLDNPNELFTEALAKLKEYSEPKIDYEVPTKLLPNSIDIGDWVDIIDHQYTPPLYVKAQVKSMRESETDEDGNTATLANYQAVESGLAAELIETQKKLKLIENSLSDESKIELSILSSQGAVFDGDITSTLLTAQLKLNGEIITNYADSYVWWRVVDPLSEDEEWTAEGGPSLTVYETEFKHNAIYKVLAKKDGRVLSEGQYGLAKVVSGTHTGTESPVLAIDGETWTKPDKSQWILKDGEWEERVDQATITVIENTLKDANDKAGGAKDLADILDQKVKDAQDKIGSGVVIKYNKNRVINHCLSSTGQKVKVVHNGDGFVGGKNVVLSFKEVCVPLVKSNLTLNFTADDLTVTPPPLTKYNMILNLFRPDIVIPPDNPTEPTDSKFENARVVNLADYGGVGDSNTDNFSALKAAINATATEPLVLEIDEGIYHVDGNVNDRIQMEPWETARSQGLRIVGKGNVIIRHKNNRTVNRHEYWLMQLYMATNGLGLEVENITIDGIRNPQEELFYTQSASNPVPNIPLTRGISTHGAHDVTYNNVTFKNMYGGYGILLEEYRHVNIKNVIFDKVGGNDTQESFGMAIYLGGHSGDATVNIDNVHAQGMVTTKGLKLSWIGVVLENGSIQSSKPSAWMRDKNTTVNITNSSFMDYQSTFHVESMAGNVYWNVDNLNTRASNYQIVAGVYGEYKEVSNGVNMDMMPYGRLWGIVHGLYYSEAQESADNISGHNRMDMYNSVINLKTVAGFNVIPQAVAYGSNVKGYLHNVELNDLPYKLVQNGSALLYDSVINLAQSSSETRQSLQNGMFSNTSTQKVEFNNTTVNPYNSRKDVVFGIKPAFVKNEGFVPPYINLPITPPI